MKSSNRIVNLISKYQNISNQIKYLQLNKLNSNQYPIYLVEQKYLYLRRIKKIGKFSNSSKTQQLFKNFENELKLIKMFNRLGIISII